MTTEHNSANYALAKLREVIDSDMIGADRKLPTERALATTLGIGRHALRQALDVLETEGLIYRKQGAGTFLGTKHEKKSTQILSIVQATNYFEIMEVRLRLEPQIAELAAQHAKPADIVIMRDLNNRIRNSQNQDSRELWDGALHRHIAQCANNSLFLKIFDILNAVRQDVAWQNIRSRKRTDENGVVISDSEHTAIIDAIANNDSEGAALAMHHHLTTVLQNIRETSASKNSSWDQNNTAQSPKSEDAFFNTSSISTHNKDLIQ